MYLDEASLYSLAPCCLESQLQMIGINSFELFEWFHIHFFIRKTAILYSIEQGNSGWDCSFLPGGKVDYPFGFSSSSSAQQSLRRNSHTLLCGFWQTEALKTAFLFISGQWILSNQGYFSGTLLFKLDFLHLEVAWKVTSRICDGHRNPSTQHFDRTLQSSVLT